MFWALYGGEMLTTRPPALEPNRILSIEPETFVAPTPPAR
jgi:hypothetical protein